MVEQPRIQVAEMHFDKFRNLPTFCLVENELQDRGMFCSNFPTEAMLWIKEVVMVDSVKEGWMLKGVCRRHKAACRR